MSGNTFGTLFKLTTFGESHGPALGGVVDGCPPGLALSEAVLQAKTAGLPVIAVGTTSARSLEGMHRAVGGVEAFTGETQIYLFPGSTFHVVDALLTNFHLPESSLLIMVSALAGRERIMDAYAVALAQGFRFFSYGDAMLIV